jgi:3-methyladenine DNA glycosylase Tag
VTIPERIKPESLADYLEVMSRAVFQAGLSWAAIERKWDGFLRAFHKFDASYVANLGPGDIDRLAVDESILRSRKKIEATKMNAQKLIELDKKFNGFQNYLHSFENYEKLARDIKKQFKFMGELNAYYFLFRVGEPVPNFEEWVETIPGDHPRMKEMIELARKQDRERNVSKTR